MSTLNNLTLADLPLPIAPTLPQRSSATTNSVPVASYAGVTASTGFDLAKILNEEYTDAANAAGCGGSGPAVVSGLALSDGGGLKVSISDGIAVAGAMLYGKSLSDVTIADDDRTHFWLKTDQTIGTSLDPATPPSGAAVYLGSVLMASGSVSEICDSGVLQASAIPVRKCADVGAPTDSPPSTLVLITETSTGRYLWDGQAHCEIMRAPVAIAMTDANKTLTGAEFASPVLKITGSPTAGRDIVLPNVPMAQRTVWNATGQALTFKVTGQTGIAVAAGKKAILLCDGTDWTRITADA